MQERRTMGTYRLIVSGCSLAVVALFISTSSEGCRDDGSAEALTSSDATLKGGVPASVNGKGRSRDGDGGSRAAGDKHADNDKDIDGDAGADADCAIKTHGASAMHNSEGKADRDADTEFAGRGGNDKDSDAKCRGMRGKGRDSMGNDTDEAAGGPRFGKDQAKQGKDTEAAGASAADDDDDQGDEVDDQS
jgi:hypothetical protein